MPTEPDNPPIIGWGIFRPSVLGGKSLILSSVRSTRKACTQSFAEEHKVTWSSVSSHYQCRKVWIRHRQSPTEPTQTALLSLLADIRAAVGDPTGRLMQDELVQHCRQLLQRAQRCETLLEQDPPK